MKRQLYINQIMYFKNQLKIQQEQLKVDKEKGNITETCFKNTKSRLNGHYEALNLNLENDDIQEQIMNNLVMYKHAEKTMKINVLDNKDPNTALFYMLGGAIMKSLILLIIYDNPQSCCPMNKDLLLNDTLKSLNCKLEEASSLKDKKVVNELKSEINIITKQYQDNLKLL